VGCIAPLIETLFATSNVEKAPGRLCWIFRGAKNEEEEGGEKNERGMHGADREGKKERE